MTRIATFVGRLSEVAAVGITVIVFAVMLAQVFYRYVLNSSLLWSDQLSVWCLAWVVFLGAVGLVGDWRHVHVVLVLRALPMGVRMPLIIVSKILSILFLGFLAYEGALVFNADIYQVSPVVGISSKWAKLAIPVGAGLMLILAAGSAAADIRAWLAGRRDHFSAYGRPDAM
jgi:TRAP-type C4-dicarboxylate transport system permease small subunit